MADQAIGRLLGHLRPRRDLGRAEPVRRGVLEDVEVGGGDVAVAGCRHPVPHALADLLQRHPQQRPDQGIGDVVAGCVLVNSVYHMVNLVYQPLRREG